MDVGSGYYTIVFTTAEGNRLFGPSGTDTTNTNINSAASVKGMKFFQSMRSALDVPAADLDTSTADAAFQSGTAAMHITGLWNVVPFEEAGIDFGVTTLPALPGDKNPCASFSGTRAMFVSAYSDHPDEANDFAAFLLTPAAKEISGIVYTKVENDFDTTGENAKSAVATVAEDGKSATFVVEKAYTNDSGWFQVKFADVVAKDADGKEVTITNKDNAWFEYKEGMNGKLSYVAISTDDYKETLLSDVALPRMQVYSQQM